MCYEPADHAVEPRQALAAWAIFATLLVTALGAGIGRADLHDSGGHEALQTRSGGAGVMTLSAWLREEHDNQRSVCAGNGVNGCPVSKTFHLGG